MVAPFTTRAITNSGIQFLSIFDAPYVKFLHTKTNLLKIYLVHEVKLLTSITPVSNTLICVAFVEDNLTIRQMPLCVQYGILKIMYRILCKTKEVDPIKLISLRQVSLSTALKYIINNSV